MFEKLLGKLNVTIIESDLPNGWWGAYDPTTRTIKLSPGLAPRQHRSTLSHELAHAFLNHTGQCARQEREAEELSATWLIRICDFRKASMLYSNPIALAHELNVLPGDLDAYMRLIRRTQKQGGPTWLQDV